MDYRKLRIRSFCHADSANLLAMTKKGLDSAESQNLARKVLQTIEAIAVEVLCLVEIFGYLTR